MTSPQNTCQPQPWEKGLIPVAKLINVAGVRHYDGFKVAPSISVGDQLGLLPEPSNIYDPQAIKVYWGSNRLGYVPKPLNAIMMTLEPYLLALGFRWDALAVGPACTFDLYLKPTGREEVLRKDALREELKNILAEAEEDVDGDEGRITINASAIQALAELAGTSLATLQEELTIEAQPGLENKE